MRPKQHNSAFAGSSCTVFLAVKWAYCRAGDVGWRFKLLSRLETEPPSTGVCGFGGFGVPWLGVEGFRAHRTGYA